MGGLPPSPTSRSAPSQSWLEAFGQVNTRGVMAIALLDVTSNLVLVAGLFLAGSGLYMVIYSSVIVFTAIGSRLFIGRRMPQSQWLAVWTITIGLSLTALGVKSSHNHDGSRVVLGIFVSILGTWIHSFVYTLNDYFLSGTGAGVRATPRSQCVWVGLYATILTTIFMIFFSVPTLAKMPLTRPDVMFGYFVLVLSSLGHSVSYFDLVESTGAVATGVIQALRAVLVFGISHIWFCEIDSAQCFTSWKGLATLVVILGVMGFAYSKGKHGGKDVVKVNTKEDILLQDMDAKDDELEIIDDAVSPNNVKTI
ncbi:hypothetical protein HDU76_001721 [Blyttiomyces sp. JEL0837]|nr:hypothetical protein HDU76_001721 [Blyttiomyces sp. JEL0837]